MKIKKQKLNNLNLILIYFFISIVFTILFNGFENINFTNTEWLFLGNDMSAHQTGWNFFKNDIWRFPFGSNPDFGNGIGNSIIYSDSIPLFAFIFKLFNFLLPEKFQYFGLWFILCFFLQGILSYFLTLKITNDIKVSFLSSIFFIIFPAFIYRMGWHPALFAHWTLIITIFLVLQKDHKNNHHWIFLILLTSLIHFYFTVIVLITYNILKIFSLYERKINLKKYLQHIIISHSLLIFVMFCAGYFEVRIVDTFALGFGIYKLNLLSILDPVVTNEGLAWSWILPDLKLSKGEELEGFNFVGSGGLVLLCLTVYLLIMDANLRVISKKIFFRKEISIILILVFFLSLSNTISLGSLDIISIPLHDFLYGPLSIIRSSGRLFWFISYFILFYSIFVICLKFKKRAFIILLLIVGVQLTDTSASLSYYKKKISSNTVKLKDKFWSKNEIKNMKNLMTTRPINYNPYFDKFAYYIVNNNFKKTNIIKMARIDRSKAAKNRYDLINNFIEKKLDNETIYILDNIGHLHTLKEIYKNENVGFFKRDKILIMIKDKQNLMNENDKKFMKNSKAYEIKFNNKINTNNIKDNDFLGFGWSHNLDKDGIWNEGNMSNIIFNLEKDSKKLNFEFDCIPFLNKKIKKISLDIFVNGKFNNKIKFDYNDKLLNKVIKTNFKIKEENLNGKIVNVEFRNENPISPLDILISPDSRKLGFLLLNFKLLN